MRRIRVLSIIIFVIAVLSFGIFRIVSLKDRDMTGPKITMAEESVTVSCEAAEEEMLAGITATDKRDGDVSDSLIVESMTNFIEKGRRNITVAAFDSTNHVSKATREIIYSDYHSPTFGMEKPLKFPLNTENILDGVSASDVLDGNLTANIKISSDYYVKVDQVGDYPVVLTVTNSAGDVSELPVTVQIYDPTEESQNPQIELSAYLVQTTPGTAVDPWSYVQSITLRGKDYVRGEDGVLRDTDPAENQERTSISQGEVSISQDVDYNTPGVYEITYQFEDEGDTGVIRLVVVVSQ